jgi:N-acetylmuramoyl-L-alanine amidase
MKRVAAVLILAFSVFTNAFASSDLTLRTVVIDAGHGGKDPGAVSKDGKTREKDFTLDIAQRLEKLIQKNCPDVKTVLTRDDDTFISLDRRAEIANQCEADLFISIHINAAWSTASSGFSIHVLGQSSQKNRDLYKANLELVKRENSVIMLDEGYNAKEAGFDPSDPSSYIFMTMMQSAHLQQSIDFAQIINQNLRGGPIKVNRGVSQDPFYVLWKTTMPAVLVELGFISNQTDLAELKKPAQRQELAKRLFQSFIEYKKQYDASTSTPQPTSQPSVTPAEPSSNVASQPKTDAAAKPASQPNQKTAGTTAKQAKQQTADAAATVRYGVQIFAVSSTVSRNDGRLLGYEPLVVNSGKLKKYVIGVSDSEEKARAEYRKIKAKYPDSFMVKISGETLVRIR